MTDELVPDQFNLVVSGMDAIVAFYRRLGLTIPDTSPAWRQHHRTAELATGIDPDFDSVRFARHWNPGFTLEMGVLGIKVASREAVDRIFDRMTDAGYLVQSAPHDAFWGARYAVLEDPEATPPA